MGHQPITVIRPLALPERFVYTDLVPEGWTIWDTGRRLDTDIMSVGPNLLDDVATNPYEGPEWRIVHDVVEPAVWHRPVPSGDALRELMDAAEAAWLDGEGDASDLLFDLPPKAQGTVLRRLGYGNTLIGGTRANQSVREDVRPSKSDDWHVVGPDFPGARMVRQESRKVAAVPISAGQLTDDKGGNGGWRVPEQIVARGIGPVPDGWVEITPFELWSRSGGDYWVSEGVTVGRLHIWSAWMAWCAPLDLYGAEAWNQWDRIGKCCGAWEIGERVDGWRSATEELLDELERARAARRR